MSQDRRTSVSTYGDLVAMLDELLPPKADWEAFYADRELGASFLVTKPDENLLEWFHRDMVAPRKVLEIGCGHGRNALYMARQGCEVEAVDGSSTAIARARELAAEARLDIDYRCASLFELKPRHAAYHFIYDCGLLHHLAPHRRPAYFELVKTHLASDGRFGLVCFNEKDAPATSDAEIYRHWRMPAGIGFSEARLRDILSPHFDIVALREMRELPQSAEAFGKDICWAGLMQLKAGA